MALQGSLPLTSPMRNDVVRKLVREALERICRRLEVRFFESVRICHTCLFANLVSCSLVLHLIAT